MHFQVGDGQAKLVRCARGAILDVVVDIRRGSPTFGQWEAHELDDQSLLPALRPRRLRPRLLRRQRRRRRALQVLVVLRRRDRAGLRLGRPRRRVDWPLEEPVLSTRDVAAPRLHEIAGELPFDYSP